MERRGGLLHGLSHAVRQQIGRPHDVHELLVDPPSTLILEALGFDEKVGGRQGGRHAQQEE